MTAIPAEPRRKWTALKWEQEFDRHATAPQPDAVETALAEHRSVVERARDVLQRCHLDPMQSEWGPLIREIGRELAAAESAMLKNSVAIIRETFGKPPQ